MHTLKRAALVALASACLIGGAAAQNRGVELGLLDCLVDGGTGFIFGSTKDVTCTYKPASPDFAPETYFGAINKFGLDIGYTGSTTIQWVVLAPTDNIYAPGALAGDYVGASADASIAVGGGANLLVGRSAQTFTLQPLSVQTQTGVNLAVGVTEFQLRTTAE